MKPPRQPKGDLTRRHVLETALKLFRRRGFERTTMRDIARAAGLSLGAAYHYFRSKEALVEAYYGWMQSEHERLAREAGAPGDDLPARIRTLFRTKLDLLRRDRKLLAALFAHLGDPAHPLSLLGRRTAALRERSIALFTAAFDGPEVSAGHRALWGRALWLAHLGVFLFFVHDNSPGNIRTGKLVDGLVDFIASAVPLLSHPFAAPLRDRFLGLLASLELGRGSKP